MRKRSTVTILFDQLSREEFFYRLEWPIMVRAWSKTIAWHPISKHTVLLELEGLDGIDNLLITRRQRGDRIFICARKYNGTLIQSGLWEYQSDSGICICYRRIYDHQLWLLLKERLVDFIFASFLRVDQR